MQTNLNNFKHVHILNNFKHVHVAVGEGCIQIHVAISSCFIYFSTKHMLCIYILEGPPQDLSNEFKQTVFLAVRNKKIF